jgi:chaperonin GroES
MSCFGSARLLDVGAALLAVALARQGFLGPALFARLQVVGMTLDFLDDVFLLNLALKAAKRAFYGFAVLNDNFRQSNSPHSRNTPPLAVPAWRGKSKHSASPHGLRPAYYAIFRSRAGCCAPEGFLRPQRLGRSFQSRGVKEISVNLRPLHDHVVIRRIEQEETARGGIIIPDSAKEKPQQGEVIAVGQGKVNKDGTRAAPDLKPGDRILFGKYSGSDVKIDGQEYLILREEDILGVLTNA